MTNTSTCFSCPLCTFIAISSIPLILSHLTSDPNFRVDCGIDGTFYRRFSGLYQGKHRHCNIIRKRAGPGSNIVPSPSTGQQWIHYY